VIPRPAVYAAAAVVAAGLSFAAAAAHPDGGDEATALDGESLFTVKGCAACHDGPDGISMVGAGPSLARAPTWAGERVEGLSAEEYLEQSMRSPSAFISPAYRSIGGPNDGMPSLQLSDREIAALVDYLLAPDRRAID
jgi:mono/diheme cytochrome c family protein